MSHVSNSHDGIESFCRLAMMGALGMLTQSLVQLPGFEDVPKDVTAATVGNGQTGFLLVIGIIAVLEATVFVQDDSKEPGWHGSMWHATSARSPRLVLWIQLDSLTLPGCAKMRQPSRISAPRRSSMAGGLFFFCVCVCVCVCVYTPRNRVKMDTRGTQFLNSFWTDRRPLMKTICFRSFSNVQFEFRIFQQGAQAHCGYLCQRSYSTMGEAQPDQLCVPAIQFLKLLTSCYTALFPSEFRWFSDALPLTSRRTFVELSSNSRRTSDSQSTISDRFSGIFQVSFPRFYDSFAIASSRPLLWRLPSWTTSWTT